MAVRESELIARGARVQHLVRLPCSGCNRQLLGEPPHSRVAMPRLKTAPELANPVNADSVAKLRSDGERLAGPLAALLDLAQGDQSSGEDGQGGAAMLPERRV